MKLNEILNEENYVKLLKWLDKFSIQLDNTMDEPISSGEFIRKYINVDTMKIKPINERVYFYCGYGESEVVFDWILDKNVGNNTFLIGAGENYETSTMIIESFNDLPHSKELDIGLVTVKSLAGIESMTLKTLTFSGEIKFECGLLRLLKAKIGRFEWDDATEEEDDMYGIISDAIENKTSLIDCQNALIDAGFEKYAKL